MAKKNNIRSIRFSDDMIEMIESQAGESFTAKFEALVTRCMWEMPAKERELKLIQERIDYERKRLARVQKQANDLENNICRVNNELQIYCTQVKQAAKNLKNIIEET